MTIDTSVSAANVNSFVDVVIAGGTPPYGALQVSAGEVVDGDTMFTPDHESSIVVTVTDADSAQAQVTLPVGGSHLFIAGGGDLGSGVFPTPVYRSEDGAAWTTVGEVPAGRYNVGMVVYDDAIWLFAGRDAAAGRPEVYRSEDGASWTLVGSSGPDCAAPAVAVFQRRIWSVGCAAGGPSDGVWSTTDGVSWTEEADFPLGLHGGRMAVVHGSLAHYGGHASEYYNEIYTTPDGASWTLNAQAIPYQAEYMGLTWHGGDLYLAGGSSPAGVQGAYKSSDGFLFAAIAPLPSAASWMNLLSFGGTLYAIGDGGEVWTTVDGSAWTTGASWPQARDGIGAVVFRPAGG